MGLRLSLPAIYFARIGQQEQGVFRVPVAGGKEERVADMTGLHLTGHFGFSMSLDPTDAPLVLRDTGTDDIYALSLVKQKSSIPSLVSFLKRPAHLSEYLA